MSVDEAAKAIWQAIDSKVYLARHMATKDLRGHASPETIERVAQTAHTEHHA